MHVLVAAVSTTELSKDEQLGVHNMLLYNQGVRPQLSCVSPPLRSTPPRHNTLAHPLAAAVVPPRTSAPAASTVAAAAIA